MNCCACWRCSRLFDIAFYLVNLGSKNACQEWRRIQSVSVEGDNPVTLVRLLVKVLVIAALYTVDDDLAINLNSLPWVTSSTVMGVFVSSTAKQLRFTTLNHGLTLCTLYFLFPFAGISLIRFYGSHFRGLSLLGYQWSTPTSCLSQFGLLLKQPELRIPFYYIFNFTGNTSTTRKLNEYSSSWLAADLPCKAEVQWLCRACVR